MKAAGYMPHGKNRTLHCESSDHKPVSHKQESERVSWSPWGSISLGVGWTRCFLKMSNQFPQNLHNWVGLPPNQFLLFPGCSHRSLSSRTPLHHFDFYGTYACLSVVPTPIWFHKEGKEFFLSNYLANFLHIYSKNLPLPPSWPIGRDSLTLQTDCLLVTGRANNQYPPANSYVR